MGKKERWTKRHKKRTTTGQEVEYSCKGRKERRSDRKIEEKRI
jgi:hypothetical protein